MSAYDFWDGDADLARDYRKAYSIQREQKNYELWLQGMYVYEAMCCASPLMRSFAKKGTQAHPYASEPYPLTKKEREQRRIRDEKRAMEKNIEKMRQYAATFNEKFKEKER